MRVAGVRLSDGGALWIEAGSHEVHPGDRVWLDRNGARIEGEIFVAPDQLIETPAPDEGRIVQVERFEPTPHLSCQSMPGDHMPPLGSRLEVDGEDPRVVAIDAVHGVATALCTDGAEIEIRIREDGSVEKG